LFSGLISWKKGGCQLPFSRWKLDFILAPWLQLASIQVDSIQMGFLPLLQLALAGFLDVQSLQNLLQESGFDLAVHLKSQTAW
jgi:hypothetical protein